TVAGLLVAIPSMFGYNWLVHTLRIRTVEIDNYAQDLISKIETEYLKDEEEAEFVTRKRPAAAAAAPVKAKVEEEEEEELETEVVEKEEVMRRFSQRNSLVTLNEINITPLLDLAFVLLIIFVITRPLLEQTVDMQLQPGGKPDNTNMDQTHV